MGSVRVNLLGSLDVLRSLGRDGFLETRLRSGSPQSPGVETMISAPERLDVTAQRLEMVTVPDLDVPESLQAWFRAQFGPGPLEGDPLLLVLSLAPALTGSTWLNSEHGYVVTEPAGMTDDDRSWLEANFERCPTDTEQIGTSLDRIADHFASSATEVAVFNVSTFVPGGTAHWLREGDPEPLTLLANRLDLVLDRAAASSRLHVVDADRIVAEFGAGDAVESPATYGDEVSALIADEAADLIAELPGIHDVFGSDAMRLTVPRHDRRTERGTILNWHVTAPCALEAGADLFDVRYENIGSRLGGYEGRQTGRAMTMTVVATRPGHLREVRAKAGEVVEAGAIVGVVTGSPDADFSGVESAGRFPVGVRMEGR